MGFGDVIGNYWLAREKMRFACQHNNIFYCFLWLFLLKNVVCWKGIKLLMDGKKQNNAGEWNPSSRRANSFRAIGTPIR